MMTSFNEKSYTPDTMRVEPSRKVVANSSSEDMDRIDWGVPDWRDWGAYLRWHRESNDQVRWAFLRRHPSYRQAWLDDMKAGQARAYSAMAEHFGLDLLCDPALEEAPRFLMPKPVMPAWSHPSGEMAREVVHFVEEAARHGLLLIAIDPSLALKANQERIADEYGQYKVEFAGLAKESRIHKDKVPDYLRMIDARSAGARYEDIKVYLEDHGRDEISLDALRKQYGRAIVAAGLHTGVPWPRTSKASS